MIGRYDNENSLSGTTPSGNNSVYYNIVANVTGAGLRSKAFAVPAPVRQSRGMATRSDVNARQLCPPLFNVPRHIFISWGSFSSQVPGSFIQIL